MNPAVAPMLMPLLAVDEAAPTLAQFYDEHPRLFAYDMSETDELQILYDRAIGALAGANLIANGAFDVDTTGWNTVGSGVIAVEEHDGSNMLRVSSTAAQANNDGTNTNDFSSGSGNIYRVKAYVDVETGTYTLTMPGVSPALSKSAAAGVARSYTFEGVDTGVVRFQLLSAGGGVDHLAYVDNVVGVDSTTLRDAVLYGAVSQAQLGPDGEIGAILVASTGYAKFQARAIVNGLTAFTHHIRAKFTDAGVGDVGVILFKLDEYSLAFNASTGELTATVHYGTSDATAVTSTPVPFDEWVDIHFRIDNTTKTIALFLNGVEATYASAPVAGVGDRVSNTNGIRLWNNDTPNAALQGLVNLVNMFDEALALGEVGEHINRLPDI